MMGARLFTVILGTWVSVVLLPLGASAQSSFAGVVRDASGGVLPGVTVEAASPALIERVRTVTTDGEGRYRIVDLRPGLYSLTFALGGFSTVVRADLELAASVVVTINVELKVGAVEETLTVTGQTPIVDVQQASRTQVLQRTVIDALPTARTFNSIASLAPGLRATNPDVGGSLMTNVVNFKGHGVSGGETMYLVDGFSVTLTGGTTPSYFNDALGAEVSLTTSAVPAETAGGGFVQSYILRDGGNTFSASGYGGGTDGPWIAKAVSDEMRRRGIRTGNTVSHIQLFNGTFGGPVIEDKLWFITATRHGSGTFRSANYPEEVVLLSGDRLPSHTRDYVRDVSLRLTAQLAQPLKFSGFFQRTFKQYAFVSGAGASAGQDPASAMFRDPKHGLEGVGNAKLTWTPSSRILVEGGYGHSVQAILNQAQLPHLQPARFSPEWYALARRTDTALNFSPLCSLPIGCQTWGGANLSHTDLLAKEVRAAVSYVTGSHNLKIGIANRFGGQRSAPFPNADLTQNYVAGRPSSVSVQNSPTNLFQTIRYDVGLYVQDAWTFRRLTLTPGVRIQWFDSGVNASAVPEGRFVPARTYPELKVPGAWGPDVAPRFAAAYDVFGDGKTALKGSVSKYYRESGAYAAAYSPAGAQTDSRNWFDCDFLPGTSTCSGRALPTNGDDIAQDNEIGPSSNPRFGLTPARTRDPNYQRAYNWEYTLAVQREVLPRLSVTGMYYRRTWGNIGITDRSLISRADYTSFQVPTPAITQDPDVAAVVKTGELITVYNLNAAKRGEYGIDLVDTNAPDDRSVYTALELGFAAQFGTSGTVFGSWTMDRNVSVFCSSDDNPNGPATGDLTASSSVSSGGRFCDQRRFDIPFQSTVKLAGNFPVKYGIETGVVWQGYPGSERTIIYTVPANLFPGGRTNTETIILNEPGSLYLPNWNQIDFNLRKQLRIGKHLLTAEFGLYNAFNSAVILSTIDSVGSSLGTVQTTLNGRTPRIGLQYKF